MKIKPAKVARRVVNATLVPVNACIAIINMAIGFAPVGWSYVKILLDARKEWRHVGLYQFTDRKGRQISMLLLDSRAQQAINDPDNHSVRQGVLNELLAEVAVDERCPDFEVPPAIFQWSHPVWGFRDITRLGDASPAERKEYIRPLSDGTQALLRAYAGF